MSRAQAIFEKLGQAHPDDTAALSSLAGSYSNAGSLYRTTGQSEQAERSFTRALDIQQKLADSHPTVSEFRSHLAKSHFNIGLVRGQRGRHHSGN